MIADASSIIQLSKCHPGAINDTGFIVQNSSEQVEMESDIFLWEGFIEQ